MNERKQYKSYTFWYNSDLHSHWSISFTDWETIFKKFNFENLAKQMCVFLQSVYLYIRGCCTIGIIMSDNKHEKERQRES